MTSSLPSEHPAIRFGKTGVLLVNLGTPAAPTPQAIRAYLKEFLSDRRVIELPSIVWQPILRCFVLTFRPKKLQHNYEMIWLKDVNASPLAHYTKVQAESLGASCAAAFGDDVIVDYAMCYGEPSINERIHSLQERGAEKIILLPLYPQYSATTTAAVVDKAFDTLKEMRRQPALITIPPYHDHPAYIDAHAAHYAREIEQLNMPADTHLLFSFHGLPERYFKKGDPYHCHCRKTARLLAAVMQRQEGDHSVAFQSRFGKDAWLKPYAEPYVKGLAQQGVKRLAMCAPGFLSDCLETLEEIAIGLKETFIDAGGEEFYYLPCINAEEEAGRMIFKLTEPFITATRQI